LAKKAPPVKVNKRLILIIVSLVVIGVLYILARVTNAICYFKIPSISNYPTLKKGSHFFASNLIAPKRVDLICYYADTPESGRQQWAHRLCGIEGDTIEIINGRLFVNNQDADAKLSLAHQYIFPAVEFEKTESPEIDNYADEFVQYTNHGDSIITYLSDDEVKLKSISAVQKILPKEDRNEFIYKQYSHAWNKDNFGPVVVPKEKYFVMGDNRDYSYDSRYIGFIDKANYIATVFDKK
jgi:signal peptidase I